jgi:hypothetical protein
MIAVRFPGLESLEFAGWTRKNNRPLVGQDDFSGTCGPDEHATSASTMYYHEARPLVRPHAAAHNASRVELGVQR